MEGLAATYLSNPSDPSMLTTKEIKDSWGSFSNLMLSYGLKPYNPEDCEEAVIFSRHFAENRGFAKQENKDKN